jgi:hypothetical protein
VGFVEEECGGEGGWCGERRAGSGEKMRGRGGNFRVCLWWCGFARGRGGEA